MVDAAGGLGGGTENLTGPSSVRVGNAPPQEVGVKVKAASKPLNS